MSALVEETHTALVGRLVTGKVYVFCPVIDGYQRSHLGICRNLGCTHEQLNNFTAIISLGVGYSEG